MASSIWTIEYFSCPSCGLPYTATRELHPDKHSGKFKCEVCETKVHEWSGNYDFFDWKVDVVKSPAYSTGVGLVRYGAAQGRANAVRAQNAEMQSRGAMKRIWTRLAEMF